MNLFLNTTTALALSAAVLVPLVGGTQSAAYTAEDNPVARHQADTRSPLLQLAQATGTGSGSSDNLPSTTVTPTDTPITPAPQAEPQSEVTNDTPIATTTVTPTDEPLEPDSPTATVDGTTNDAPIASKVVTPTDEGAGIVPGTQGEATN